MPKVLIYVPTCGRGGVHTVIRKLTNTLAALPSEFEFSVLGQRYDEQGLPVEYPRSWPFEQIDPVDIIPGHPAQFEWLDENAHHFYNHLKRASKGYDLIFWPSPWYSMATPLWDLRVPFIAYIPDFAFDFIQIGDWLATRFQLASSRLAQNAALTVFTSTVHEQHARATYGFRRTRVIPHSADYVAENFTPTRAEAERVRLKYGLPDRYALAFHCYGHKGGGTIIAGHRAARAMSGSVPPLVIAGIDTESYRAASRDPATTDARRLIASAGIREGVDLFILGQIADGDVAGLTAGADVSIAASESEGDISGVMFEAMMAQTPLIYSDLPVFAARFGDIAYGLTFPVGQADKLAFRLVEACEYPDLVHTRAQVAYGWAGERTAVDVANEYLDAMRDVLNG